MKSVMPWLPGSPVWKWILGLRLFHRCVERPYPLSDGHLTKRDKIIARIQTPSINIRRNINGLLTDVGKHHPQALIYPLTVASKSSSAARKSAALTIMDAMQEHSATIVEQVTRPVSSGLPLTPNTIIGFDRQPRAHPCCDSLARVVA